ncbi:hypothetical protein [uncultured Bacteroides sp.]|uniref:hypothetical protein n=1 Tax=uncultured Bacteroides sp. TaxID=162156 RepID=UPI002AA6B05D|nr:hypothetical protein [uncultured Bacteroides sp.]
MNNLSKLEIMQSFLTKLWQTFLSIIKILLQSKRIDKPLETDEHEAIVILGNGPSLRPLIEQKNYFLEDKALLAVNYAVLSAYYTELKPHYYLVADPAFFLNSDHCDKLFDAMAMKTTWDIELHLSVKARKSNTWQSKLASNPYIHIHYFNVTPVEGFTCFMHLAFRKGWGTPRPRNVLIPSIMVALKMPFHTIYIAGADHSWLKEIWVNDDNVVIEDLNHFYDKKGSERFVSDKHLHDLLLSMYVAFKSYHIIEAYTRSIGKKIYNVTEGSFIDAFDRKKI